MFNTRFRVAALIFSMTAAVLFFAGLLTVLLIPALAVRSMELIPIVVIASFVLAAPLAWGLAPRLRARFERRRSMRGGISVPL
ncbi:hypothetical protein HNR60_003562 [Rhodopseudomonas rhenobacensis]|uniref:Uncharacterized protein n=1 Tax=Rhodopseudomonas rhenobacensis TaxID=87461 RepID=A0A7W7Z7B1_9BRAD|nr:hypothetical protein [Rhodopseudomonas rhenobacensis]MBB5048792.1 hypothetical protein [Rhodopseudomonas rhenobacensis]